MKLTLPLIPQDKANHFIYGFTIYLISNLLLTDFYSLGVVFLFAIGKEIKDQIVYKGFDWKDLITTMIPGILIILTKLIK